MALQPHEQQSSFSKKLDEARTERDKYLLIGSTVLETGSRCRKVSRSKKPVHSTYGDLRVAWYVVDHPASDLTSAAQESRVTRAYVGWERGSMSEQVSSWPRGDATRHGSRLAPPLRASQCIFAYQLHQRRHDSAPSFSDGGAKELERVGETASEWDGGSPVFVSPQREEEYWLTWGTTLCRP
jgi:hypothetical protein